MKLGSDLWIRVSQMIRHNHERPEKVTTASYSYSYGLGSEPEPDPDQSWLLRYDYVPEQAAKPGYEYPVAHVHFNGTSESYSNLAVSKDKPFHKLHCPTGRITLEDFIEHLIIEFDVPTHGGKEAALKLLADSRGTFQAEKRTR